TSAIEADLGHVVQDEEHAFGSQGAGQVLDRPGQVRRVDQRLDGDDHVVCAVERRVVAAEVEAAVLGHTSTARLPLGDAALHAAEGEAVVAAAGPIVPAEHGAAESAAGVEHAPTQTEVGKGDVEEVVVD